MRIVPVLALAFLTALTAPATALVEPPVETPIPLGNGVFFDYGELVATVEFQFLDNGCLGTGAAAGLAHVEIIRHFLGFDKYRSVWADMQCLPSGDDGVQVITLIGNEALTPASNLKLVGTGGPALDALTFAGTYRDGYLAVVMTK